MPLYEYQCKECGRRTEKIQKFSDPELTVCPYCNGKLERTLTAPAIQFKGGGWYKDLYSSAKPGASPSADGAKPSADAAKSGDATAKSGDAGSKPAESTPSPDGSNGASSSSSSAAPSATPASPAKS